MFNSVYCRRRHRPSLCRPTPPPHHIPSPPTPYPATSHPGHTRSTFPVLPPHRRHHLLDPAGGAAQALRHQLGLLQAVHGFTLVVVIIQPGHDVCCTRGEAASETATRRNIVKPFESNQLVALYDCGKCPALRPTTRPSSQKPRPTCCPASLPGTPGACLQHHHILACMEVGKESMFGTPHRLCRSGWAQAQLGSSPIIHVSDVESAIACVQASGTAGDAAHPSALLTLLRQAIRGGQAGDAGAHHNHISGGVLAREQW